MVAVSEKGEKKIPFRIDNLATILRVTRGRAPDRAFGFREGSGKDDEGDERGLTL